MSLPRLGMRQKSLALLAAVGATSLIAFALILYNADRNLFGRFIPEHTALHQVEFESSRLVQQYYSFMFTTDEVTQEQLSQSLISVRSHLELYLVMVENDPAMITQALKIVAALDQLERSSENMVAAGASLDSVFERGEALEKQIRAVFRSYQESSSDDIARAIEGRQWESLIKLKLPDLRMIADIHRQVLELFLDVREFQLVPSDQALREIEAIRLRIDHSLTLLRMSVENSDLRAAQSAEVIAVYDELGEIVDRYTAARRIAAQAVAGVESASESLSAVLADTIAQTESQGWESLHRSLLASGGILIASLVGIFVFLYLSIGGILRPLKQLQGAIVGVGDGNLQRRAQIDANEGEIGRLADDFNAMADRLEANARVQQTFIQQLEQKNTELERFTYTVSHELKSPLVTVAGFVGLLEKDLKAGDTDRVQVDMQKIVHAIDTMSSQLEDLLELARVGHSASSASRFSMTLLCSEVVELMQGFIQANDAVVTIESGLPEIYADRVRIGEVMKNLIENGIKFAVRGQQPRVSVSGEQRDGKLLLRVVDNGPGIDPRYHDRVFELFDRLDNSVAGTGVGLALVKRIIEIHDGDIWIGSEGNGQGCCFCFTLALAKGE